VIVRNPARSLPFFLPPLRNPQFIPGISISKTDHATTSSLSSLCFHGLTNCFSRNSLVFKIFCCPRGVPPNPIQGKIRKTQLANSSFINNSARCTHHFPNGKRCRLYVSAVDCAFCSNHAKLPQNQREPAETAAFLTADLKEFRSAIPINEFLARLLLLLAENKISPRRAAVLAYITNQLLRTLPAIDRELNPKEDPKAPTEIIWDIPSPERDRVPAPDLNHADVRT
jgi:hypothetical protein